MTTLFAFWGILPFLLGTIPFGFLAIYLVLRWRDQHDPVPDPHLGLKTALLSIATFGLLLALGGATAVVDWGLRGIGLGEHADPDEAGAGLGFALAGGLAFRVASLGLRRTNAAEFPRAARMFRGFLGVLSGLVAVSALALGASTLFTGQRGVALSLPWSAALVWTASAWVLLGGLTRIALRRPGGTLPAQESGTP